MGWYFNSGNRTYRYGRNGIYEPGVINEMAKQGAGNIITSKSASQTGARQSAEFATEEDWCWCR